MRTLDEVIKAWSICFSDNSRSDCTGCPYADIDGEAACFNYDRVDALHYLKEYRDKAHRLDIGIAEHARSFEQLGVEIARYQEAVKNCEEAENKYRQLAQNSVEVGNPPLTWDELKSMEEKPVWLINTATEEAEWVLVGEWFDEDEMRICRMWRDYANYISREFYGNIWQAYRKEI